MAFTYDDFLKYKAGKETPEPTEGAPAPLAAPAAQDPLASTPEPSNPISPRPEPLPSMAPAAQAAPTPDPLESAYQKALKTQSEDEFKNRGLVRGLASDVAGGVVDYGEMGLRAMRTLAPSEGTVHDTLTRGIEGIESYKAETPFLQEDPDGGFLSRSLHGGVRSAAQSLTSGLPGAAAGFAIGSALGPVGSVAGGAIGAVVGYATSAATQFGLAQYDDVMDRGVKAKMKQGMTQDEARSEVQPHAIREAIYEGGFELASDLFTGWTMGAGKLLTAPGKAAAKLAVKDLFKVSFKDFATRGLKTGAVETGSEMLTSGFQAEEEHAMGLGDQRFWNGALDAFGPSAVASIIFAGLGHANVKLAQRRIAKTLENPNADPEKRASAVDAIASTLESYDPTVADVWRKTAHQAIEDGRAISTNENILDLEDMLSTAKTPKEAAAIQKKLDQAYADSANKPLPWDITDLELERQFLESAVKSASPATMDMQAITQRLEDVNSAIDTEENFQLRWPPMAPATPQAEEPQAVEPQAIEPPLPLDQQVRGLTPDQVTSDQGAPYLRRGPVGPFYPQGVGHVAGQEQNVPQEYPGEQAPANLMGEVDTLHAQKTQLESQKKNQGYFFRRQAELDETNRRLAQFQEQAGRDLGLTDETKRRMDQAQAAPETGLTRRKQYESERDASIQKQDRREQYAAERDASIEEQEAQEQLEASRATLTRKLDRTDQYKAGKKAFIAKQDRKEQYKSEKTAFIAQMDAAANAAATSPANDLPEPTEKQKEAGTYTLGHVKYQGLDLSIENPKGSIRKGVGPDGKPWETRMKHHYGYIKGTVGKDKDHLDTFIGGWTDKVFVVDQVEPKTGNLDEHKVMLGFETADQAKEAYHANYAKGWKGFGNMTEMSMDQFKDWAKNGNTKKPAAPQEVTLSVGDTVLPKDGSSGGNPLEIHAVNDQGDVQFNEGGRFYPPDRFEPPAKLAEGAAPAEKIDIEAPLTRGEAPKTEIDQAVEDIKDVRDITEKEAIEEKGHVKKVLEREIRNGNIPVGYAVRSTIIDDLAYILKNKKLRTGRSQEGTPGISATRIADRNEPAIPLYGAYDRIPFAIISPPENFVGKGMQPGEVLLDPNTDVTKLQYAINTHDELYRFEQLPEVVGEIKDEKNGEPEAGAEKKTPQYFGDLMREEGRPGWYRVVKHTPEALIELGHPDDPILTSRRELEPDHPSEKKAEDRKPKGVIEANSRGKWEAIVPGKKPKYFERTEEGLIQAYEHVEKSTGWQPAQDAQADEGESTDITIDKPEAPGLTRGGKPKKKTKADLQREQRDKEYEEKEKKGQARSKRLGGKQDFELTLDDGAQVKVTFVPNWSSIGIDHLEFRSGLISQTGYKSDFAHGTLGETLEEIKKNVKVIAEQFRVERDKEREKNLRQSKQFARSSKDKGLPGLIAAGFRIASIVDEVRTSPDPKMTLEFIQVANQIGEKVKGLTFDDPKHFPRWSQKDFDEAKQKALDDIAGLTKPENETANAETSEIEQEPSEIQIETAPDEPPPPTSTGDSSDVGIDISADLLLINRQHPDYHDRQDLAAKLWGFKGKVDFEAEKIQLLEEFDNFILLGKAPNGKWTHAGRFNLSQGGGSAPLSVFEHTQYHTREYALEAAIKEIQDQLDRYAAFEADRLTARDKKAIKAIKKRLDEIRTSSPGPAQEAPELPPDIPAEATGEIAQGSKVQWTDSKGNVHTGVIERFYRGQALIKDDEGKIYGVRKGNLSLVEGVDEAQAVSPDEDDTGITIDKPTAPKTPKGPKTEPKTQSDIEAMADRWLKSQEKPDQGSWDGSALGNYRNTFILPLLRKLTKNNWMPTREAGTGKHNAGKDLQQLREIGIVDIAWTKEGDTRWAMAGTQRPDGIYTEDELDALLGPIHIWARWKNSLSYSVVTSRGENPEDTKPETTGGERVKLLGTVKTEREYQDVMSFGPGQEGMAIGRLSMDQMAAKIAQVVKSRGEDQGKKTVESDLAPTQDEGKAVDQEEALAILSKEFHRFNAYAAQYEGGKGIPVGAEGVDYRWKADAMRQMGDALREGKSLDEAEAYAKAKAREWIETHNKRRPKDINWKRWEGAADTAIEHAKRLILGTPAKVQETDKKGQEAYEKLVKIDDLNTLTIAELQQFADDIHLRDYSSKTRKPELVERLDAARKTWQANAPKGEVVPRKYEIGDIVRPRPGSGISEKNAGRVTHIRRDADGTEYIQTDKTGSMHFAASDWELVTPDGETESAADDPEKVTTPGSDQTWEEQMREKTVDELHVIHASLYDRNKTEGTKEDRKRGGPFKKDLAFLKALIVEKEAEGTTKGAADQIDEMSMDEIDKLLDEGENAATGEAPAAPEPITIETTKPPGKPKPPGDPKPPKTPKRPKKTAAEIITSATSHGVKGIDEAVTGLLDLFGGKALKSGLGAIDEDTYNKAKPHFQKSLEEFQAAGRDIKEFIQWAYDNFSTRIKPYLRRFIAESKGIDDSDDESEGGITIDGDGTAKGKKRKPKIQDTGEVLGGKRSGMDHRTRSEAIEIELNGVTDNATSKQIAEALDKKTTRSDHFRVNHPVEFRTPGVKRFLELFRSKLPTWGEAFDQGFSVPWGSGKNPVNMVSKYLERHPDEQQTVKQYAARYIATLEQFNEAVKHAVTVAEARQALFTVIVGEEKANRWVNSETMVEDVGQPYKLLADGSPHLTDIGKSLAEFIKKSYDFSHFLMHGWEDLANSELDETKNLPIVRQRRNIFEIQTPDTYRNNLDVTPETLIETFKLRGVDFGEWVEGDFRQRSINLTFDSFKMLSEAIGVNDHGVSLSDDLRLGIGFGARGRGGRAAAEFYPDNKVIALTKTKGDGSLAHEWAHAFDFMTKSENMATMLDGYQVDAIRDLKLALSTFYKTENLEVKVLDILRGAWSSGRNRMGRMEEAKAFLKNDALDSIREQTVFESNAKKLDAGKEKYWSLPEEMFARAFEAYVADKLQGSNTYLVDKDFVAPGGVEIQFNRMYGAYPTEAERERFNTIFDDFFGQLEWSEEGIPKLKQDYVPVTTRERKRAETAINELYARVEAIFEALYSGEQSPDGLYWYAFEQTGRGTAAQPKGYSAFDDDYDLSRELVLANESAEGLTGKGAVGYADKLKSNEVLMYFLRSINHTANDHTITLEAPDGTDGSMGPRGHEALEEAPPEDVRGTGSTGGSGGIGDPGTGESGGRGDGAGLGEGDRRGDGEGDDSAETDLPPLGGGNADTSTGHDAIQSTPRINHTIYGTADLEKTNTTDRFNHNIAAIRTLLLIEGEGRLATAEEQAVLVKYNGWGELSGALSSYPDKSWQSRANMVASLLSTEEIKALRRSTVDAYYTPPTVALAVHEGLQRLGFAGGRVLEPSCGIGHFFGTMPNDARISSSLTGVDIDGLSTRIAKQLYQTAQFIHQPFEETALPENFYDLTISNVPFGTTIPYDKTHNPDSYPIHDFFINKMIALTKPGGIVVAITSTGTLDKEKTRALKKWGDHVELISAVRLPNGIFPGALAGADILFFRKKGADLPALPKSADWTTTTKQTVPHLYHDGTASGNQSSLHLNSYYVANPENILGTLGAAQDRYGDVGAYVHGHGDIKEKLTAALDKLPASIIGWERPVQDIDVTKLFPESDYVKDHAIYEGKDGKLYRNLGGTPEAMTKLTPDQIAVVRKFIDMRKTVRNLLRADATGQPEANLENLRKLLKSQYKAFVKKHGAINLKKNARVFVSDPDAGLLFGLENWDATTETVKSLSPIFTESTVAKVEPPKMASTAEESLLYSLMWRGRIDLPYMQHLTGKTRATLLNELKGKLYDDPEQGHVTQDEYLSGNVRHKLATAKSAAKLDPKYQENVDALEAIQPIDIPINEIGVRLGAAWVDPDTVVEFVNSLFGNGIDGFYVDHIAATGLFKPHFRAKTQAQARRYEDSAKTHTTATDEYGTRDVNFFGGRSKGILDYALNGGFPTVKVKDKEGHEHVHIRKTDAANAKLVALHARFRAWVTENDTVSERFQSTYNERFNSLVDRQFNGAHLTFPGKVPDALIQLRPHQKNAIWRYLQTGIAYLAHEVGTGKTYTMIGAIMESRRLGLAKKPVFLVKKATIEQIASSFLKLYPGANILVLKVPKDAQARRLVLSRIATGDYDCIILNHNAFERIPLLPETQREMIAAELEKFERALYQANAVQASRHSVRDIARRVEALRQKLREATDVVRDDIPTLEEMGIDMIVVDEAHTHKNIGFATQYANLKGVESGGSDIASDLYFKTQYLHARYGRGILMASGTPLTNSVGELFNISRYLHPHDLERLGIDNFDSWANTFGIMKKEAEPAPEGGRFKLTTRFAEFMNIPELMSLVRQHMDVRTADDLKIPRPDIIGGKPDGVYLPMTEYQKAFQLVLKDRLRHIKEAGPLAEYRGVQDNMLRIVGDGRMVAMDPRLYDPAAKDEPGTKTNRLVEDVFKWHHTVVDATDLDPESKTYGKAYKEKNHVQLIFADRGVPGQTGKFSLYGDIKKKLIAKGIPAHQIAFIHDAKNDDAKAILLKKVQDGEIRIIIGSTPLMGIGVNIQDRVSAMYHMDVDWTYANYEQRNGRGWRFGNRVNHVAVTNYGVMKTVDAFMWGTVAYKERILKQVMSNDPKIRNILDISKTSMEASEMEGMLADDPLHKEKIELEEETRTLNNIRAEYESSRTRAKLKLARAPGLIQAEERTVENNHRHLQIAEAITTLRLGAGGTDVMTEEYDGTGRVLELDKDGAKNNAAVADIINKAKDRFTPENNQVYIGRLGYTSTEEVTVQEKDPKTGKNVEKKRKIKRFFPVNARLWGGLYGDGKPFIQYSIGKDVKYDNGLENGVKRALTNIQNGLAANMLEAKKKGKLLEEEMPRLQKLIASAFPQEMELAEKELRLRQVIDELLTRQEVEDAADAAARQERLAGNDDDGDIVLDASNDGDDDGSYSIAMDPIGAGIGKRVLETALDPILKAWKNGPAIAIHQSLEDLPDSLKEKARRQPGTVEGVYDPATRTVHLIGDGLRSIERAQEVLLHEAVGHHGVESILGKQFNRFLDEVIGLYGKKGLQDIAAARGFDLETKEGQRSAAKEKLAQMAETGEKPGLLKRLYEAIRKALRGLGFKLKIGDEDIRGMLERAQDFIQGGAKNSALGVSGDETISPEILFSLSPSDLLAKATKMAVTEPKLNLKVFFGNGTKDLREVRDQFRISAWLSKVNATVKQFFDRQNRRDKERSTLYRDFLKQTETVFDLDKNQLEEFSKLAFGLENRKVVDAPRYKQTGERVILKGSAKEIVKIPVYALNEPHYAELSDYLRREKVSQPVRVAYMDARRTLDQSLLMLLDRMADIKGLDPNLIQTYRNQVGRIENYFPHNRYGNYSLKATDPNAEPGDETRYRKHFFAVGETHAKRWYGKNIDDIILSLEKEDPSIPWRTLKWSVDKNRQLPEEVYDFPIPVDAMQKIIESAVDNMPEDSELRSKLLKELSQEISNTLKSRGFGSHMIKRKDIPGFEKTDVSLVLHDHFAGFSGWLTKMEAAHDFGDMLRDIDAKKSPNDYRWAIRFTHDMLENATKLDRFVDGARAFFFLKYLGGNVKTAVVNLTQNVTAGIPRLSMDMGAFGAGRTFVKACKDLRLSITEAGIEGTDRLTPEEKRFLMDMFHEGWGQSQFLNEVRGKVGGPYRKLFGKASRFMGLPMEMAERYNRMSLGLAAFRAATAGKITNAKTLGDLNLAPGQKASYDMAKDFAEGVVNDAHFIYSKGNRPAFLRGTPTGKVMSTGYTFRSFSHNMLSLWRWMLTEGEKEGRQAFGLSMLAMVSLGGLGAVPLYGLIAALIRQLFGEDPLESGVRAQLPPGLRDIVMYGAPSIMGVNIGGSIGMEVPVLDRANVNKSWSDQIGGSMGQLIGIPYSVLEETTKAVDALRSGKRDRALETIAPTAVKNVLSAIRLATEGQTAMSGQPINVPGETGPRKITGTEAFLKSLGFQPTSSTKAFDVYRTLEEIKSFRDDKQSELANRFVAAQRKNDTKEMTSVRHEAMDWNRKAHLAGRYEMKLNLDDAIKARLKGRQPMRQMRGLAKDLRENYGI